jgi:ribosomal protein S18 acetylase RimI-like enzyme
MLNNKISIIKVTPAQVSQLQYISRKTFTEAFTHLNNPEDIANYLATNLTLESLHYQLANPGSEFYFIIEGEEPIAYFKINTGQAQTELKEDTGLEIERIYVLQNHQGRKLGHRIIAECIQLARKKGKAYIWLGVWEHNLNAIRFYKNNGFVAFDKHSFLLGNDLQTDIMMKLVLSA